MGATRFISVERLNALAGKAIHAGCVVETWRDNRRVRRLIRWDVSGGCETPVVVEQHARYSATHGKRVSPMCVILETQCRDCGWCRNQRRKRWAARAHQETTVAPRTWFLTLTAEPETQFRWLNETRAALARKGTDFDELTGTAKFSARVQYGGGREITRFIKRVRKNAAAPFRYLLVAEQHASGAPHFHMLVHETSAVAPISKRTLQSAWIVGFSKVVLCHDLKGAMYLCKYLAKDASTRVRASFRYGGNLAEITTKLPLKGRVENSTRDKF